MAGSEENFVAVKLYESIGFRWTSELMKEMLLEKAMVPGSSAKEGDEARRPKEAAVDPLAAVGSVSPLDAAGAVASAATEGFAAAPEAPDAPDAVVAKAAPAAAQEVADVGGAEAEPAVPTFGVNVEIAEPRADAQTCSAAAASGATPYLTQLRISPRLSANRFSSLNMQRAGNGQLMGDATFPPLMTLPPPHGNAFTPPPAPELPLVVGKRRAVDVGASSTMVTAGALPELKSARAAHDASPRSPRLSARSPSPLSPLSPRSPARSRLAERYTN